MTTMAAADTDTPIRSPASRVFVSEFAGLIAARSHRLMQGAAL
jgi:hypothetical protein